MWFSSATITRFWLFVGDSRGLTEASSVADGGLVGVVWFVYLYCLFLVLLPPWYE